MAQLEDSCAKKESAAGREGALRAESVKLWQEQKKAKLAALSSLTSTVEEEEDDLLLLKQMEVGHKVHKISPPESYTQFIM